MSSSYNLCDRPTEEGRGKNAKNNVARGQSKKAVRAFAILARVRYWEVLLYQRFTGKLTGKRFLPVNVGKMQFFKVRAKI